MPLAAGSPVWVAAGPVGVNSLAFGLVTGRVSALALDPSDATGNHLYVGTTGGGVWKSQNAASIAAGSVTFLPLTDDLAVLRDSGQLVLDAGISVGAATVQPGGTGVVLAGLGDPNDGLDSYYGAGILRSADGGNTWALIQKTMDFEDGLSGQDYWFVGEGFAGFAWSSVNAQLVVAAVSQAYEGTLVDAGENALSYEGLYYSADGGATWHLARISDLDGTDVQGPGDLFAAPDGNAASAVVWNPVRQVFVAAVRYHGYYQSSDGMNWTQLAAQPGTGFTAQNCPTVPGGVGVAGCPIFRGSLAVNPQTGDTFAWSVDAFNQDQGIWQDQCGLSGGVCGNPSIAFGVQLGTGALEVADGNGPASIENGAYNLTLAAAPASLVAGADTLVFAGDNDLWKCSLAAGCAWRNTTNSTTCASAMVGEYQHSLAWDTGNPLLVVVGTDSGLWRSEDGVGETGSPCAATDATHWQNLNGSLGSLAEVESLAQSGTTAATMLAGLGANGFAGVVNAPATAGDWNEVLGGEGGVAAIDATSHLNSWYANNGAGVSIYHCASSSACTAAGFGSAPVVGEAQVEGDGLAMPYAAEFRVDAEDPTQLLIGTCRVWRGPANGVGWTETNAISPILDGTGGSVCDGNALIRSIAAWAVAGGGEVIFVGMAGDLDGGGIVPGHVFSATIAANGMVGEWTDLTYSPVGNDPAGFNAQGLDVSALYVDPHDTTGGTVYATISGFSNQTEPVQQVYRSTNGGALWTAITSNLPNEPANAVLVDAQDTHTAYVAMDTGVYVTRAVGSCGGTGVGTCWAAYGTGLPESPVTQLAGTPSGATAAVLTAGTYGRGIWQIPLVTAGATLTTAAVSPTSLTFTSQTVGTTSAAKSVFLKNTGAAALTVTSVDESGNAAGDFSETDNCVGVALKTNAGCTMIVSFTPTAAGRRVASLTISANVAGGELLVPLAGTGLSTGSVTLLPTSLSFGTVEIGTNAATQAVNVQNVGGSTVTGLSVAVSAPFTKVGNSCGSTLAAGVGCAVTVGFTPAAAGPASGSLTVTDSVGTQSAALSGVGIAGPTDTLSTASLSFPATVLGQTSQPLAVTIKNTGGLPLTAIGSSVTSSAGVHDFVAVSNCGSTLAAGSSCAFSVTFSPSVAKAETGTLTISDALRAQTVGLAGTGLRPPAISLAPTLVNFGSVEEGVASAAKTVTISNTGGSPLAQPSFSFTGVGLTSFSVGTTTCGASVAAGGSCAVQVIFTPQAAGATTALLTVATSSPGVASVGVNLTGVGLTPPMIEVSPPALNLGTVDVGYSSDAFTVAVTNTGQVAMTGLTFRVSGSGGTPAADFALSAPTDIPACSLAAGGQGLNPGASCNVQVTFSPSLVGTESATLTAMGANAIPPTATVSLTGVGASPIQLQANVEELSFPATPVGTTSATLTLSLSNVGRQAANGLALSVAGPYGVVAGLTTCKTTLAAKSSCTVGVSFSPTASGDQPGVLTATVSNLGVPALAVALDGSGVAVGGILLNPTQMTFGSVVLTTTSAAQTLTVTNSGAAALTGLALEITGDYSLTANACPAALAAQANCTAGVQFTPTATGNHLGTVSITSTSAGVAPGMVSLTGYGIPAGSLSANPAVVSFGTVTVGQTSPAQSVTLTNGGTATLTGLTFQTAGDYSVTANSCPAQLTSGAGCSLMVAFSPVQPGTRIGSIMVQSTLAGSTPLVVGLEGTGLAAAELMVTPGQLAFGGVVVGSNSAAMQLTVANPGTGTLTGLAFATAAPFSVGAAGSGSCGSSLPAGGSCGLGVEFSPIVVGNQNGVVTVSSGSLGVVPVAVSVSGTGVAAASLSLNPPSLTFPGTTVGTTSAGETVTVTNPGGVGLAGLAVAVSGDFAVMSSSCAGSLAAGANCTVVVSFTPTVVGGRQGFLTASSTTPGVATASALLNGTGLTGAALSITPGTLTFATTRVGQVSATQTAMVQNMGQSGTTNLTLGVTPGFELVGAITNCTAALAASASCTVGVAFAPNAGGTITGSLTASAGSGAISAAAALIGVGAAPPGIATTPASLVQFGTTGVGEPGTPMTVTVTNPSTLSGSAGVLQGLALAISPTGTAAGFGLSNNTCGATLAAGASCTASVTFVPASAGALGGTLLVSSSNGSDTVSLTLAGVGFDFQFALIGSGSMTVVQGQTANYTLSLTPLGATSGVSSFGCGGLPANAECVFNPPQLAALPMHVSGNVALGIGTGAATSGANRDGPLHGHGSKWRGAVLLVCGLLAVPLGMKKLKFSRTTILLGMLVVLVCGVSSCAGSGGSGGQLHSGGGTPPGSYRITVTASSNGVSHSLPVTLVVD